MAVQKKYPLGRGLDALIATHTHANHSTQPTPNIGEIELSKIIANPNQPRREFSQESLEELAESIRQLGLIQPITLRSMNDGTYQIISGERRMRAAQMAGLLRIPAYVRKADDEGMMQMALVENIQREDLNAIEIALAYQNLMEEFGLTQEALAEKVGKKRATIANSLRLLRLPAQVQMALKTKVLDPGHARALLGLDDPAQQIKLFNDILRYDYSVRQVEELVKQMNEGKTNRSNKNPNLLPQEYVALRDNLANFFQTKVAMTCKKGKGTISIAFANENELERIISLIDQIKA